MVDKTVKYVIARIEKEVYNQFKTQRAFAAHIKKSYVWVNSKLRDRRGLSVNDLIIFAKGLNMPASDFLPPDMRFSFQSLNLYEFVELVIEQKLKDKCKSCSNGGNNDQQAGG